MKPLERLSWLGGETPTLCAQSKVFWKVLSRILSPVFPFMLRSSHHIKTTTTTTTKNPTYFIEVLFAYSKYQIF